MENEYTSFEEILKKNGHLTFTNTGTSMQPLIREGRDVVVISKSGKERYHKYDVVLYRRDGRCVLHRILKVTPEGYVIAGDNNFHRETDVTDDMIIGVLTGLIRDGKKVDLSGKKYKLYVHLVCDFYFIRAIWLWIKYRIRVIIRIVRHKINKIFGNA